jgi:hypothetical protein
MASADPVANYLQARWKTALQHLDSPKPYNTTEPCFGASISCNQTLDAYLSPACYETYAVSADFFSFTGTAGQAVTITMESSDFAPFIDLQEPSATGGGNFPGGSAGGTTSSPASVAVTLDNTGSWTIGAGLFGLGPASGNYTLSLECSGSTGGCVPDANTLCLVSGRFSVTATYNAGASGSGQAHAASLTDDTGYLWFFAASNVEAVVKVINGCGLGGHYWVFAGGLTNVDVVMTVTDTQTNISKTYTNPANTTFLPIQDTSAFSTCP